MSTDHPQPPQEHKVLLVDDDRDQRLLTWDTICMNAAPCQVRDAASAEEALAILNGETGEPPYPADVLYVDIEMPGMTGLNLLERIRQHPAMSTTTVFVVSGSTDGSGRRLAEQLGANGFVNKSPDVGRMMMDLRATFSDWPDVAHTRPAQRAEEACS
jgi:CheY-like chemotaxis protein